MVEWVFVKNAIHPFNPRERGNGPNYPETFYLRTLCVTELGFYVNNIYLCFVLQLRKEIDTSIYIGHHLTLPLKVHLSMREELI